ncbi:porin [uncultured Roseovarius sp.]|uniref:porin n=1 Tax=uncultured Roseovarius sp. TaxID=293344 RepID=UPI0025E012E1|nr:porin [uncultured Roseovarius sp.]
MKKQLLCTSAIALGCAVAAPASAQEWDMDWGGYYNTHVGFADVSGPAGTDFDGVDVFQNGEIHFTPSVTLDNGMTFGINIQYEAKTTGGAIVDESYASISSDTLGRIDLGNENSAGYKLSVAAPQVSGGIGINSPSISAFIPVSANQPWTFRQASVSSYTEVAGNNDVQRITYYTPSFNGLTLGVSYAATNGVNAGNNGAFDRNAAALNDIFDLGAKYSQSFNGVDVALSARWGTGDSNVVGISDPEVWALGAVIGVSGFEFGGSYAENDNGGAGGVGDQEGWSLGATYDIAGPWAVGLDTYQGEVTTAVGGGKAEYEAYQLVGSRSLGAGVTWAVYAAYAEGTTNAADPLGVTKIDGTMIGTSINLSF